MSTVKKREHQEEWLASKRQKQDETISSSVSRILNIPDEILIKIILHLNARDRVALGNCCMRFNSLVFGDKSLLSDLDFSEDGRLTSAADIQQYFNNENTSKYVLKVNIKNTNCITPGYVLNNSIGKGINLVDINIHGIKFKDAWQLGSFLRPLLRVQRLFIDWPETRESNIPLYCHVLQKPFGRLIYLSVEIRTIDLVKVFIPSLRLCQDLRELHMLVVESYNYNYDDIWDAEPRQLRNLKIVEYCGPCAKSIKERFMAMIPDPEKWADFQLSSSCIARGFHLENIEVCEELLGSKGIKNFPNASSENQLNLGWTLIPELLLKAVLRITHLNMPEEFCCLSTFKEGKRCLIKIHEAKQLLKNPRSQISYVHLNHPIELGCDIHLIASAFPNLTELVLSVMTRSLDSFPKNAHFERHLKKRANAVYEKRDKSLNINSSFEMLIKNTPQLRHLTLGDYDSKNTNWDLDALHLIPLWKNLETLRLQSIPIADGNFLIEIGKRCKHLQKLELLRLGSSHACCYKKELLQMLTHCKNLRDFSIEAEKIGKVSEVFTSLANNTQLRRVRAKNLGHTNTTTELVSSIKQLLHHCSQLIKFASEMDYTSPLDFDELSLAVQRLASKISRPNFQIEVLYNRQGHLKKVGAIYEDTPHLNPFSER